MVYAPTRAAVFLAQRNVGVVGLHPGAKSGRVCRFGGKEREDGARLIRGDVEELVARIDAPRGARTRPPRRT